MKRKRLSNWVKTDLDHTSSNDATISEILRHVRSAESMVVFSSPVLADDSIVDAMLDASHDDVRCYIMTSEGAILNAKHNTDKAQKHNAALKRLSRHALVRSADNFHARVVLIDPYTKPKGMLLTANLTVDTLKHGKVLQVPFNDTETIEAANVLRWAFWEYSHHEIDESGSRMGDLRPLGEVAPVKTKSLLQTAPHAKSIRGRMLSILDGNPENVFVSSDKWDQNKIVDKLCKLSRNGSRVTVITRYGYGTQNVLEQMRMSGIRVVGFENPCGTALVTNSHTLVTSADMERHGLERRFDIGLEVDDERAMQIRDTVLEWSDKPQYTFQREKTIKQ